MSISESIIYKGLIKNVSLLALSGCFIQNDLSKIPELLTENCCSQGPHFQMTLKTKPTP